MVSVFYRGKNLRRTTFYRSKNNDFDFLDHHALYNKYKRMYEITL